MSVAATTSPSGGMRAALENISVGKTTHPAEIY
jgi:hypothetical protein